MLSRRWRRALDTHLTAAGMTDATWRPLVHLKDTGGGLAQKDLAMRIGVDTSSLVRVLDILEREDLIERRRDDKDGRTKLVYLTQAGLKKEAEVRRTLRGAEALVLEGLSDTQVEVLLQAFSVINQGLGDLEIKNIQPQPQPQSQSQSRVKV